VDIISRIAPPSPPPAIPCTAMLKTSAPPPRHPAPFSVLPLRVLTATWHLRARLPHYASSE